MCTNPERPSGSDYLKEGQEVKVKVIGIDQANRINLSIKKVNDPQMCIRDRDRNARDEVIQMANIFRANIIDEMCIRDSLGADP